MYEILVKLSTLHFGIVCSGAYYFEIQKCAQLAVLPLVYATHFAKCSNVRSLMDFMHTENVHTLHNVYTKFTEETKLVANMLFGTKTMSWFLIGFCLKHDSYTLADGAEIHSLRLDTVALQHKPHRKQDTNRNAGHCSNTVPNVKRGLLSFCYTRLCSFIAIIAVFCLSRFHSQTFGI